MEQGGPMRAGEAARGSRAPGRRLSAARRRGQAGITLIELMVGIFIAAILSIFIYKVLIDQNTAFRRQDTMVRLQQNLRFAMEFVSRGVEMAGYGTYGWTIGTSTFSSVEVVDGAGASDQLQVLFADPSRLAITKWGEPITCDTSVIPLQNDQAAFKYADASYMLCYSYINSSRLKSYLLKVDGYDLTNNEVQVTTPSGTVDFDADCDGNFPPDMLCAPANWYTFYVDNVADAGGGPGSPTNPVLMIREATVPLDGTAVEPSAGDSVLAEDIEFLQVEICKDDSDCGADSDWDDTFDATAETGNLRQIRLRMYASSDKISDTKTLYPNPITGVEDNHFRITGTTSVLLRNLRRLADYN